MLALIAVAALLPAPQDGTLPPAWQRNRAVLVTEARLGLQRGETRRHRAARSSDTARAWQELTSARLRAAFRPLPAPDRTAPGVQMVRRLDRDGYRVEHLLIESHPGVHVTAHAWVPDSATPRQPAPGVLLACGHAKTGKSADLYQRGAATLARSGFVVLVFDPLDQGERLQSGAAPSRWGTRAHNVSGLQALLVGWTQAGLQAWDSVRCLDALAARDDVDAGRLAVCGNSGGGTQSAQLFALDARLVAAAPSCYLTSYRALLDTIGPQDCEQNLLGQLAAGLDHADYLAVRAPRPALICSARDDFFPIAGTRAALSEATRIYTALGQPQNIDMATAAAGHGWHPELIEATARWFAEHLLGDPNRAVTCVEAAPLGAPDEQQVTAGGRVLDLSGERSVFDLLADAARSAAELRDSTPPTARLELARDLCGVRALDDLPEIRIAPAPPGNRSDDNLDRRLVETLTGMALPAAWIERRSAQDPVLLAVGMSAWRAPDADAADPRLELARTARQQVLCLDPIALGDAAPAERGWYGAFGHQAHDAALCRLIDRPLLGLQIEQILAVARELASAGPRVDLHARGAAALAALHAAAFEPQLFGRIDVEAPLSAWADLLAEKPPLELLPLAVPRALECYELADLRAVVDR